ncbi:ATP-grasp domain-containing protein [Nocardioides sp.]|uniref:ATP-grasp domain-containing protein n=1 Tax=Nocardioides sp. TaxID=35761 RepID=UPI0035618D92
MPHAPLRRALVVGSDDARGLLAAVRSLSACGWQVGVATPHRRSLVASSRHATHWHRLGPDIASSVSAIVDQHGYDVVLPGGDTELLALSDGRADIGCAVPYGSQESVRCILDKWSLFRAASAAGLATPYTRPATPEAIAAVESVVVLKARSHTVARCETVISADPDELREAADRMRELGVEPLLQQHLIGRLSALTVVLGEGGEVLAAVQQQSDGLWPPEAGISVRASTVPLDTRLLGRVVALLQDIGWRGLAEVQFLDTEAGPMLIDVNGRCYGSLALAAAAGVHLADVWASMAIGDPRVAGPATVGTRYQWLYGDLRRAWREGDNPLQSLAYAFRTGHSVWDVRDVRPSASYLRTLARAAVRR